MKKSWLVTAIVILLAIAVIGLPSCGAPAPEAPPVEKPPAEKPPAEKPPEAPKVYTLKLATYTPPGKSWSLVLEKFVELVEERSEGRLKFDVYYAQDLVKGADCYDAVKVGTVDMASVTHGWVSDVLPISAFLSGPIMLVPPEKFVEVSRKVMVPAIQKEMDSKGGNQDIIYQLGGSVNPMFFKEPVHTLEDWNGKKLRTWNPFTDDLAKAMGGTGIPMSASEASEALIRGMVDGATLTISTACAWKWWEIVPYVPKRAFTGAYGAIQINRDVLNSLPKDLQEIMVQTGREVNYFDLISVRTEEDKSWVEFAANGGHVYTISDEESKLWDEIALRVCKETAERTGPEAVQALEAMCEIIGLEL